MSTQQVLGVVGGIVGAYFGYPQLGFILGSLVGVAVTPGPKTEGPRLNDLSVQGSAYGQMIPVVYGAYKLSGNVIFSTDIREVATVNSVGKGGGGTNTTYSYNVDMAVLLCDNEIAAVRKMYNDGKLIYDASTGASLEAVVASELRASSMRVYLGTETQLPDPTIEATLGVGNVPAYRGSAYIVFEQLDCPNGRIPQLSFEVLASASTEPVLAAGTAQNLISSPGGVSSGVQPLTYVSTTDQPTRIFTQIINTSLLGYVFKIDSLGYSYIAPNGNGPQTEIRYQNSGVAGHMDAPYQSVVEHTIGAVSTGVLKVFDDRGDAYAGFSTVFPDVTDASTSRVSKDGKYLLIQMTRSDITASAYALYDFFGVRLIALLMDTETGLSSVVSSRFAWITVSLAGVRTLQVRSLADLSLVGSFPLSDEPGNPGVTMKMVPLENGNLGAITISSSDTLLKLWEIDEDGNQVLLGQDPNADDHAAYVTAITTPGNTVSVVGTNIFGVLFGGVSGGVYTVQPFVYRMKAIVELPVGLGTILTDITTRAGLDPSQLDVSEVTDNVDGYALTSLSSARANIEPLLSAFFVDPVPLDGKIKFRPRAGQTSVATIGYDDLGGGSDGSTPSDLFPLARTQEDELPRSMAVNFINKNDDYQTGAESTRRIITSSINDQTLQLAVVMDNDKAATIAAALLYNDWAERNRRVLKTTRDFAAVDPGDVVTIEYPRNTFSPYRITRASDDGVVCGFDAVDYDGVVYTIPAQGSVPPDPQVVSGTSPSQVRLLDIPILRDADDNAGMYAAVSAYTDVWPGAALFSGVDDTALMLRSSFSTAAIAGASGEALGDWTSGLMDEINTVNVTIASGDLFSATREEVLAGSANAALLGDEIIQFRTATLVSGNTYRLSGLLRGLRGTEAHRSTHVVGERFVLLEYGSLGRLSYDLSELGEARRFKAVTIGQNVGDVASVSAVNTGEGLKPFSPVNLRKTINGSGNTVFTWDRRTRLSDNWMLGLVPLGESSEQYDVLVTDLVGTVLFEDTVTSAQWPHPSSPTNLTSAICTVWQLSSTYGRGAPITLTV